MAEPGEPTPNASGRRRLKEKWTALRAELEDLANHGPLVSLGGKRLERELTALAADVHGRLGLHKRMSLDNTACSRSWPREAQALAAVSGSRPGSGGRPRPPRARAASPARRAWCR